MSHPKTPERKRALNLALKRNLARRKTAHTEEPQPAKPEAEAEQEAQRHA